MTPAEVVDAARKASVAVLRTIPDRDTATAAQALAQTDRALEALQDALLVAQYEATRQREVKAARELRAQVDAALTKTKNQRNL